mmetsp:Transcript_43213/g.100802  ORF Transcript_43213/g.100802 Transcript_43213/m.100802 type:complete len:871 (+) Transcript_43213:22-2634(+)
MDQSGGMEHVFLKEYFGHEDFRGGQREVVLAALAGRDVAIFWTTGAGKSLCYQLPAVQSGKTVVVVSPLISLMQDQVHRFNATVGAQGRHRACFLGSAQFDANIEAAALAGDYTLVYVTPEKLTSGNFLNRLSQCPMLLLAIDEAHCISEWGHDFRPSYRALHAVRQALPGLPLMALTATASSRVQEDIMNQLQLRGALLSRSSFDRNNLRIRCTRKTSRASDLARVARDVANGGATIVYVMTQSETEMVSSFLAERLGAGKVGAYHGGLSYGDREDAHVAFLNGQLQVMVATVAFGMGIDKPDVRRIIHYGAPKTVEEYFQQIGRAGRDGLDSNCELIWADSDFLAYSGDFYLKNLSEENKKSIQASTESLRAFASSSTCRRRWLLDYFGEQASYERCGTCDFCNASEEAERDFRPAVLPILHAVAATQRFPQALTKLLSVISGSWKGDGNIAGSVQAAQPQIQASRKALPPIMRKEATVRELISMLCNAKYLQRKTVKVQRDFCSNFEVYTLTELGQQALRSGAVRLPVPVAIRKLEEEEANRLREREKEVASFGLDVQKLPKDALVDENSQVLWYIRKLQHWRASGKPELVSKAEKHEALRQQILKWRDEAAVRLRLAPAAVLSECAAVALTYVQPTTLEAVKSVGVRIAGAEDLAALIAKAKEASAKELDEGEGKEGQAVQGIPTPVRQRAVMQLPSGEVAPPRKWPGAVYKAKKGSKAPWELSFDRFASGESLHAIAMRPASGKPIQVGTVKGHLFTAWTFGKPVNLRRLLEESETSLVTEVEWNQMEEAAAALKVDFAQEVRLKEILASILGEKVNLEVSLKSEADKEIERNWYERMRFWEACRKVGFSPTFAEDSDSKRPRLM